MAPAVPEHKVARAEQPFVGSGPGQPLCERSQPVAGQSCLFEPLSFGEAVHAALERSEEPARRRKGGEEAPDELSVALEGHAPVAGREAPAHLGQGARRESGRGAHGFGAPPDGEGVLQRLLGQPGLLAGSERAQKRALALRLAYHLDAGERVGHVHLEVRVPSPGLAAPVVLRPVGPDQPSLQDQCLELRAGRHPFHRGGLVEEVRDLLAGIAVEVALHPAPDVPGLADVQDPPVVGLEQVHAGSPREVLGQPDLPEVRAPPGPHRGVKVAQNEDPEPTAQVEEAMEHLCAGLGVGQGPVGRPGRGPEVLGERRQAHVRHVEPNHPAGQSRGAHRWRRQGVVVLPLEVRVQEREVEPGVVGHETRSHARTPRTPGAPTRWAAPRPRRGRRCR